MFMLFSRYYLIPSMDRDVNYGCVLVSFSCYYLVLCVCMYVSALCVFVGTCLVVVFI